MNLSQLLAVVRKDVLTEWRSRELLSSMFVFALLAVVVFHFAFDLRVERIAEVAPGMLWVTMAFAGILGLNRSMSSELEERRLDCLLLAPMERSDLYLAKVLSNVLFLEVTALAMLPVFSMILDLNLLRPQIVLVTLLGTTGFAAVGTLLAAMATNTRAQEVLLPVLLFPIFLPAMLASVRLTAGVLDGASSLSLAPWWRLLVAFDIISLLTAYLTFEFVVEG